MENTDSMMQIRQVIEALEQKINTARRVPMTGYSMIDGGALLDLIGGKPLVSRCKADIGADGIVKELILGILHYKTDSESDF